MPVAETHGLDRAVDPLGIVRLRDRHGILSVYVDADPREQAAVKPAWVLAAENGLEEVRARAKSDGRRERWTAVHEAIARLAPELAALLDPRQPGRGRALFAAIEGLDVHRVSIQAPLVDLVALGDGAELAPLLAALERSRPAGVVVVSSERVRVLEVALGAVDEVTVLTVDPDTSDWREMKGPAAANPGLPQHSAPQRDRFERRLDEHRARLLDRAGADVERLRARRGWDRVVVAGDPRLTPSVEGELDREHSDVVVVDRSLNGLSPTQVAELLAPELDGAHARREELLVGRATDAALSGNAGALGLGDVLGALEQGRVDHLLFDAARVYAGARTADGRLVPEGVVPPGVEADELVAEPSLTGRLIERALETDARVTPLSEAGAEALANHDGIAACLRW